MIKSCGIDFGTTNTTAAIKDKVINLEGEKNTISSAVFYPAHFSKIQVGREAISSYQTGEEGRFMRSLKRVLGTDLMKAGTLVNGKSIRFQEIISTFLSHVKQKIDFENQSNTESVVMGRPVFFRDNDSKGDKEAQNQLEFIAHSVGFKNVEFQYEPIAAALFHEQKIEKEKLALVVDIGGGTSDFSVIRVGKTLSKKLNRKSDILANSGIRIGGNDFDKSLSILSFMPELGMGTTFGEKNLTVASYVYFELSEWSKINSIYSYATKEDLRKTLTLSHDKEKYKRLVEIVEKEQGHNLLNLVEESKISLSSKNQIDVCLDIISEKPTLKIAKKDFEDAVSENVEKVRRNIDACLKMAGVSAQDIELIISTGGSTEIPYVQQSLCGFFPYAEMSTLDKLSSVGAGLGIYADKIFTQL